MDVNYSIELLARDKIGRSHVINELSKIKEQYSVVGQKVVELGCGLGQNLEVFAETNDVVGIEGLQDVVREANKAGLCVLHSDLEKPLSIQDSTQDLVLCLDVLEHLTYPFNLMQEIKRVLKPTGFAVLNVPNHLDLVGRIRILFGSGLDTHRFFPGSHDWDNPHLRFFTFSGFVDLIGKSGFRVVENRSKNLPSFPFSSALRKFGVNSVLRKLATVSPSLFAGGFFFVVAKK